MSRPGPKPNSQGMKLLQGLTAPSKGINVYAPKPANVAPDPPAPVLNDKDALEEWQYIVPQLDQLGMLARIDRTVLAGYCVCYGRWMKAERAIRRARSLTELTTMGRMQRREVSIAFMCMKELRQYVGELGLSPSARSRVMAGKPRGEEGKKDKGRFFRTA